MRISKTEVNLQRLLAAAPQQKNQTKLMHYIAILREQLEQLAKEKTPEGLPKVPKTKVNEYFEKIEGIASKLATQVPDSRVADESFANDSTKESPLRTEEDVCKPSSPQLRRRFVLASSTKEETRGVINADASKLVKLDTGAQVHVGKHRKLQEDLTDEMVGLARQLKESSLMISQSVQNTEKILDSTEEAIEQSLASMGHANVRAGKI